MTYKENFGEIPKGDITKINEKEIPEHDILCGVFLVRHLVFLENREDLMIPWGTLFLILQEL